MSGFQPWSRLWLRALVGLAVLGAAVILFLAWGGRPSGSGAELARPGSLRGWNVLLVTLDTVRADRLGCYGDDDAGTPVLDALARQGVRCTQAVAPAPLTLPSHATLLTGLDPHRHGARINGKFRLEDRVDTLAECLQREGYRTGAVISAYVLDRRYGLAQGFDHYDDDLTDGSQPTSAGYRERIAEKTTERARAWLSDHQGRPLFLWVHYFDPHAPYEPPQPFADRFDGRPYDGEIAYTDAQLGELLGELDRLGLAEKTLVIVAADHGESLGEHEELTHGIFIYDATMHVPLLWRAPGVLAAGREMAGHVGLIDIMPTTLDLLGLPMPEDLDGMSLARTTPGPDRELVLESLGPKLQHGWAPLLGLRTVGVKFIQAPQPELYDLTSDPAETRNRIGQRREQAKDLLASLRDHLGQDPEVAASVQGNLPLDPESRSRLQQLGYAFDAGKGGASTSAAPDPKDVIGEWRLLQRAETLADRGRHDEAIALLAPHLAKRPNDLRAWQVISESYQATGRHDEALAAYRKELDLSPSKAEALVGIGTILLERGQHEQAEVSFRQALEEDAQSHRALFGLGALAAKRGRADQAFELFERCIEVGRGSQSAAARFNLGALHHAAGRTQEAFAAFEGAYRSDPGFGKAARALAELHRRAGRGDQAIATLRRSLERRADAESSVALSGLLQEAGQPRQAADVLAQAVEADGNNALLRLRLGALLGGAGRFDEAETHLERAVELAPRSATTHYNLGVVLAMQEKPADAIQAFRRAVELQPKHAAAHNALGQALLSTGDRDAAVRCFRRALEIDPNLAAARENLSRSTTGPATTTGG